MKLVYVDINHKILVWARNRARYTQDMLAKKVGVSLERYRLWESGEMKPTLRQLYKLARILNRSLQLFFMDDVPDEPETLTEMRRLPGRPVGDESPELSEQVQLAIQKRDIALRLYHDLGEEPPFFQLRTNIDQDIEDVARSIRNNLGITLDEQASWNDSYKAIREWRSALEDAGILVFQIPRVSIKEMRGFSLSFKPLPIIGINSNDWPKGRIFTIFHELTHILLDDTVLDSIDTSWFQLNTEFKVEHFCNKVAAAILVPNEDISRQVKVMGKLPGEDWTDHEVISISSRYQVSREVTIRRLLSLELISRFSFDRLLREYEDLLPYRSPQSGGNVYANKIAHYGSLLPRLAFRAYYDNRTTVSDLSMLFGFKAKYLGKLEERVHGYKFGFRSY